VVRDLKSISSVTGRRNAWQDMLALTQENRVRGSVYIPTIEGIVFRELNPLSDETLRVLWQSCDYAVPGVVQKRPDRPRMISELIRAAFDKVFDQAAHEAGEPAKG
jgi:hypothetical protein